MPSGIEWILCVLLFALPGEREGGQNTDPEAEEEALYGMVARGAGDREILDKARELVRKYPKRYYSFYIMGNCLYKERKLKKALKAYEEARARILKIRSEGRLSLEKLDRLISDLRNEIGEYERGRALARRNRIITWLVLISMGILCVVSMALANHHGKERADT